MLYVLALLAGIVAGSRALTAPAAVSWAARLAPLNLGGSWLAFMGYAWTPWIFTALALVELVTDQLPSTPSRKSPAAVRRPHPERRSLRRDARRRGRFLDRRPRRRRHRRGHRHIWRRRGSGAHGEGLRPRSAGRLHRGRGRDRPRSRHRHGIAMNRRFDAIVIGAGQAGPPMAGRIAATGKTVALIERKLFGGTCVNTGCTPTKTLVASAYAAHLARRAARFRRQRRTGRRRFRRRHGPQGSGRRQFALASDCLA